MKIAYFLVGSTLGFRGLGGFGGPPPYLSVDGWQETVDKIK